MLDRIVIERIAFTSGGLAVGALVGIIVAKRHYAKIADAEIESVKDHYRLLRKEDMPTPVPDFEEEDVKHRSIYVEPLDLDPAEVSEEALTEMHIKVTELNYVAPNPEFDIKERIKENKRIIRENRERVEKELAEGKIDIIEALDQTEEKATRDPELPYLISVQEFMDEKEFTKLNIVYYEEDDSLVDDGDRLIPDVEGTVGSAQLSRFGELSEDPNIVYVRNEKMEVDFEIIKDKRSYAKFIMGFDPEDEEKGPKIRKMRDHD